MFADPQSITVSTVAQPMPRTGTGPNSGNYQHSDGTYTLAISHARGKRQRHVARFGFRKVAPDAFTSGLNTEYSGAVTVTVDRPLTGYTSTEVNAIVQGIATWLATSSGANTLKLLGSEV